MSLSGRPIYRLGDIEVDPALACLRRNGQEQYLRHKTFQVLLYLLEHRHRLVTKQELIENIWPDTAVTDDALVQLIKDIRRALGDDPRQPRLIKTVPRAGYRFIAEVEESYSNGAARIETEEITSVEYEFREEIDSESLPVARAPLPRRAPDRLPRRHTFSRAALVALLVISSLVAMAIGQRMRRTRSSLAEVPLPQEAGKKAVAVMPFDNQSASADLDWLREGLADMLIADLSRSKRLTVLGRAELHQLLERAGHRPADRLSLDEALILAHRVRAEAVIVGSFARLGDKIRIDVWLHDAQSQQVIATEELIADQPELILSRIDLLSLKISADLNAPAAEPEANVHLADTMTNNLSAYRYYSLGVEQAQGLHGKEALALFEKAIQLDPQFAMAYARLGYVYGLTWDLAAKARPYLEKAFQLSDRLSEKDRLFIVAWYAIVSLDYAGAIAAFQKLIAQYPTEVEAYQRLGVLLRGEERYEEAIEVLKRGLTVDADSKDLYNALGGVYRDMDDHENSIAALQRGVQLAPDEPNIHDSLAMSYEWAGMYDRAIAEYNRALALNSEFEVAIHHLGNLYLHRGEYRKALAQFQRYLEVAPNDRTRAAAYGAMCDVYLLKADLREAAAAARRELQLDPSLAFHSMQIALLAGDRARAERLKAVVFAGSPYTARGAREYKRFEPYWRGWYVLKSGQPEEAIENFKEALRHTPVIFMPDAFEDCLANAYLELGRVDEAINEYERILKLNPNYPLAHYHLAQAYDRKGDRERARDEYTQFLRIWNAADADIPEVIAANRRLADQP